MNESGECTCRAIVQAAVAATAIFAAWTSPSRCLGVSMSRGFLRVAGETRLELAPGVTPFCD